METELQRWVTIVIAAGNGRLGDDWGYCHPSIEQMAVKCRQTERNILNLIAGLEKSNELRRLARGKGGRGKGSGSVYQIITGMSVIDITASQ